MLGIRCRRMQHNCDIAMKEIVGAQFVKANKGNAPVSLATRPAIMQRLAISRGPPTHSTLVSLASSL